MVRWWGLVLWRCSVAVAALSCRNCSALGNDSDTVDHISIAYPHDGDVTSQPLRFKFGVTVTSRDRMAEFKERHRSALMCVEIDEELRRCSSMIGARVIFNELRVGSHTARAFILNGDGVGRHHETDIISFKIVADTEFSGLVDKRIEQIRVENGFPHDQNILQWATSRQQDARGTTTRVDQEDTTFLAIGVKTAVLTNFSRRQAIRETWANRSALPGNVKVFFLGCSPNLNHVLSRSDQERLTAAVNLEREVYGDLLTEELGCQDGRTFLADKVSGFFAWVVAEFPTTTFVMIVDDDVYTRVDEVAADLEELAPRHRLYVGESMELLHPSALAPIRDPTHPYYTSRQSYPLQQLPLYAAGPHFLLSMDCVRFIAKNHKRLGTLNGQDDTSIGLWLLAVQVHLQFTSVFGSLRMQPCTDNLTSLADLSSLGIRLIHQNLMQERPLCYNYHRILWGWQPPVLVKDLLKS